MLGELGVKAGEWVGGEAMGGARDEDVAGRGADEAVAANGLGGCGGFEEE